MPEGGQGRLRLGCTSAAASPVHVFGCALPCAAVAAVFRWPGVVALLRWPGVNVDGLAGVTGTKKGPPRGRPGNAHTLRLR